jgi:hypothetical protein
MVTDLSNNLPLYKKVDAKQFRLHQYMDPETLEYIRSHRPIFTDTYQKREELLIIVEKIRNIIHDHVPSPSWYRIKDEYNTIHGIRHIMRTMTYVSILANLQKKNEEFHRNAIIAAALHDLQRENDMLDLGHAQRGAEWAEINKEIIEHYYDIKLSESDINSIVNAVNFHVEKCEEIQENCNYLENKEMVDFLKAADALDRYRLPSHHWWLKEKYIPIVPDESLKEFAFNLVVLSEEKYLAGFDGVEAVLSSIDEILEMK